jgi:hypothetical protein
MKLLPNLVYLYQTILNMRKLFKTMMLLGILTGSVMLAFADRGVSKKSNAASKATLSLKVNQISGSSSFQGMKYKGYVPDPCVNIQNVKEAGSLITYQKGNTILIVPTRHKLVYPDNDNHFEGLKVQIKI